MKDVMQVVQENDHVKRLLRTEFSSFFYWSRPKGLLNRITKFFLWKLWGNDFKNDDIWRISKIMIVCHGWKNYAWCLFTKLSSWYLSTVPQEVVFTIGQIYFSLLLLPRCLFPGFHQGTFFSFFSFFEFLEFLERIQAFFNLNSAPIGRISQDHRKVCPKTLIG